MAIKYIGLRESPSPRNTELITLYAVIKGIPAKQIVRYIFVCATDSAGTAITFTMGATSSKSAAVKSSETTVNTLTVLPMMRGSFFPSSAPTALPMVTVAPVASPTIITVSICMIWLPTETAVMMSLPQNCPVMNKSAKQYSDCSKYANK